jgi:iron complex outermembrane receptor protein
VGLAVGIVAALTAGAHLAQAQEQRTSATLRIEVVAVGQPVAGAAVHVAGQEHLTGEDGVVVVQVAAGPVRVVVRRDGFIDADLVLDVAPLEDRRVSVVLVPADVDDEVVVVASTRTGGRIEDQPMRVEVLEREEIEEKMMMTPGDIVMMLNEMGGLRVQTTSPSMGSASLRIQGMRGRYTRFFSDGLPLFGEMPGGLGLLQIPPMDLGHVEVIKGVSSALYGAGAMGGVVNLVARRPGPSAGHELLINQSTLGATDAILWSASPIGERGGVSLLAGLHRQSRTDVDGDGWADLPEYKRAVARPRFYWNGDGGGSVFGTIGVTYEQRTGGTFAGAVLPQTGFPYVEALETTRFDGGVVGQTIVAGDYVVTGRAAAVGQWHDHTFGEVRERDRHASVFGEGAIRGAAGRHTWVAGAAFEVDDYQPIDVPRFAYTFVKPGVFVQDDVDVREWLSLSVSGRLDWHSEYGTFFSPRISALFRSGGWTSRASFGTGFFGPTPLTEETEAAGLTRLKIRRPLVAERGRSAAIDIGYDTGIVASTLTFFASRIENPVIVEREERYVLRNLDGVTDNRGVELLVTARRAPFSLTGSYTYVDALDKELGVERPVSLTPRHSAGLVAMAEGEDWGRVGVEVYYTGRQSLEADPYRTVSERYVILGLLVEKRFGSFAIFLNGENLTNVLQSHWGPILRPERGVDGRWTVDAWAPLEGRVINGGVRVYF